MQQKYYLEQAIPNEAHEQPVAANLVGAAGVLGSEHRGEVEHGHVRVSVVVNCKVQVWHLVVCGVVSCLPCVRLQSLSVYIVWVQQLLCVHQILGNDEKLLIQAC